MTHPPPPKDEREFLEQVRRHHRWNFPLHWTVEALAIFGLGCMAIHTIFPAFMRTFTTSKTLIALAQSLFFAGWSFTQLFYLPMVQRHRTRKGVLLRWGMPVRLLMVILAVTAWGVGPLGSWFGVFGVFLAMAVHMVFAGPAELSWMDLMSRIITPGRRGLFMGGRQVITALAAVAAGWMVWAMIGEKPTAADFAWPFMIGAIAFLVSLPGIAMTREVTPPPDPSPPPKAGYFATLRHTMREALADRPFRRFLFSRALMGVLGLFSFGMVTPFLQDVFFVDAKFVAGPLNTTMVVSGILIAPLLGVLMDRVGCKKVLVAMIAGFPLVHALALSLPLWGDGQTVGFFVIYAVMGLINGGFFMASFLMVFEFAGVHRRTGYIALTSLFWPPVRVLASTVGGVLVDLPGVGYFPTLWIALGCSFAVLFVSIVIMPEPRKHVSTDALVMEDPKI